MLEKLSPSQLRALQKLNSKSNVFLTGSPGTGKSFLIRYFLRTQIEKIPVLASTGAAAILVGGRTFHSFFGLGLMQGGAGLVFEKAMKNSRLKSRLRKTQTLIIDEISMISSEVLDCAERIARGVKDSSEAWGGIRVICVGDFAQLPPVRRTGEVDWAFLGRAWERSAFESVALTECLRTEEADFLRVLDKIRWGEVDEEVETLLNDLKKKSPKETSPRLFAKRAQAERFNLERLEALPGESVEYLTRYSGQDRYLEVLEREAPISSRIVLKENAQVMIRMNDPKQRFVNGSVGRVVEMGDEKIVVEIKHRYVEIEKFTFSMVDADGNEVAFAENFPVSLAYAQTIHKSQGLTLDEAHLNLSRLWEPGQAYVALSRAKNREGLSLEAWDEKSIRADRRVKRFYQSFSTLNPNSLAN